MSRTITDLHVVVALVVSATIALLVPGVPWQLEWVLGAPFLLVLPGYAVVAALFPERPEVPIGGRESPGWPARFGLSLVGSVIVVALGALLLASQLVLSLTLAPIVLLLGAVTILGVGVAAVRRGPLHPDRRADPIAGVSVGAVTTSFGTSGAQSVALVVSIVVLASALAVAGTAPPDDPYSEAYLTGGEGVDVGPQNTTLEADAQNTMALAIANHEGESTDYDVVIRLQRVEENGTVGETERLDEFRVGVAANETRIVERDLAPSMTGERLRLQTLVYEGGLDGEPAPESADLTLRLWVNATAGGAP